MNLFYILKPLTSPSRWLAYAHKFPKRVKQMDRLIEDYLTDAQTLIPIPNPAFDPSQYRPELIGVQGRETK